MKCIHAGIITVALLTTLSACNYRVYDSPSQQLTGNIGATAVGAGAGALVGAGSAAVMGAPKSVIGLAGLLGAGIGGSVGYYLSSVRFDARGVVAAGGVVYQVGDMVTVEFPSDSIFEPDSADLLYQANTVLDSAAAVLCRFPNNNILISGNTSGVASQEHELKLSLQQSKTVAGYLWAHGIGNYMGDSIRERKLIYVGYGSMVPISNQIKAKGIGENRRIQITAFPSKQQLHEAARLKLINNIGAFEPAPIQTVMRPDDTVSGVDSSSPCTGKGDACSENF